MTDDPIEAAERLADVLGRENTALAALDLRGAVTLLAEKRAAAAALLDALAGGAVARPWQARLLSDLAGENRRRLEHAIAVQGRVIGLIARALRNATPPAPRYGATGAMTAGRTGPVTLSARA
jgi:hypothetical protein